MSDQITHDPVDHPAHYASHPSGVKAITLTQDMNFNLGNAFKYLWRREQKADAIEDLKKARWYLKRELDRFKQQIAAPNNAFRAWHAYEQNDHLTQAMSAIFFDAHLNIQKLSAIEHAIRCIDRELQKRGAA